VLDVEAGLDRDETWKRLVCLVTPRCNASTLATFSFIVFIVIIIDSLAGIFAAGGTTAFIGVVSFWGLAGHIEGSGAWRHRHSQDVPCGVYSLFSSNVDDLLYFLFYLFL